MEATQILSGKSVDKAFDVMYANMLYYDGVANFKNPEASAVVLFRRPEETNRRNECRILYTTFPNDIADKVVLFRRQEETNRTIECRILYTTFPNDIADKVDEAKKLIKIFLGAFTKREKATHFLERCFTLGELQVINVSICGVPMTITPRNSEEELFCRWSDLYKKMYS